MEERTKITPNEFGSSLSYRVIAQNFVDDQLVMKIKTENIEGALVDIREEHEGKNVEQRTDTTGIRLEDDEYIVKVS